MFKYQTEVDVDDPNQSQSVIVGLVGRDKRVLDVGCSTGYVARGLVSRGCTVSGVELEAEWAAEARPVLDKLVIGDIETLDLVQEFGEGSFDAVVFGDVLEHLKDPAAALLQARRLLDEHGAVVASIPNVAHGDMRMLLLAGYWDYRDVGLLDETHLRFFTLRTIEKLMRETGFTIADMRRVRIPLFGTELALTRSHFPDAVVEHIQLDPDADVYQYVFTALKNDVDGAVARLHTTVEDQRGELAVLRRELADARAALARLDQELAAARDEQLQVLRDAEMARKAQDDAVEELHRVYSTRTFRWTAAGRRAWSLARRA